MFNLIINDDVYLIACYTSNVDYLLEISHTVNKLYFKIYPFRKQSVSDSVRHLHRSIGSVSQALKVKQKSTVSEKESQIVSGVLRVLFSYF